MPQAIAPIHLNPEQIKAVQEWAANDRMWTTKSDVEFNLYTFARLILKHADDVSRIDADVEDIQRRCRAAAQRFEELAGAAKVDTVVSSDLLLEAASLLRGYHQNCLITELCLQQRDGVGVFNPRFISEDDDYRKATAKERAMARGFVTLWQSVGVQDAEDWLYTLLNRAELLASLDEGDDCREAHDNTPSLGPFKS